MYDCVSECIHVHHDDRSPEMSEEGDGSPVLGVMGYHMGAGNPNLHHLQEQ